MKKISLFLLILTIYSCKNNITNIDEVSNDNTNLEISIQKSKSLNTESILASNEYAFNIEYQNETYNRYKGNIPSSNYGRDWMHHMQGIAITNTDLVVTTSTEIYSLPGFKLPASHTPETISGVKYKKITDFVINGITNHGYNHFCDPVYDFNNNKIFVPIEIKNKSKVAMILELDLNLNKIKDFPIIKMNGSNIYELPWLGVNPLDGYYVSSLFTDSKVTFYEKEVSFFKEKSILNLTDMNGLPLTLNRIQGGEVSKAGFLYLLVEGSDSNNRTNQLNPMGIYVFDIQTGKQVAYQYAQFQYNASGIINPITGEPTAIQEFEGLAIGYMPNSGYVGNVHTITYESNLLQDGKMWFKHFNFNSNNIDKFPKLNYSIRFESMDGMVVPFIKINNFNNAHLKVEMSYKSGNSVIRNNFTPNSELMAEFIDYNSTYSFPRIPEDCMNFIIENIDSYNGMVIKEMNQNGQLFGPIQRDFEYYKILNAAVISKKSTLINEINQVLLYN